MDFLECKICHIPYDEEDHRPRNAPCGHELCTACLGAIIKDSIFECPKCRQKHIVKIPDDLPVSFGLIDVIRAFKSKSIPLPKETEPSTPGATNEEVCNMHGKSLDHWCYKCQFWICKECLDSHTTLVGCSTTTSTNAIKDIKDKHLKNIDMLLNNCEWDTKFMSAKIHELNDKKKELLDKRQELLEMAEKHGEEVKEISNLLEQGSSHKENLVAARKLLSEASSQHKFTENIKVATQRRQILHTWSVKNQGTDTPLGLKNVLKEETCVYTEMTIQNEKRHAKLSISDECITLHPFLKQVISDDSMCMPFDRMQNMIPAEPSLIFLELSLGGIVKGRILIDLDKKLSNIRNNIVHIITGQKGQTLKGIKFSSANSYDLSTNITAFSKVRVTRDSCASSIAKTGDILGNFGNGYLQHMYFYGYPPPATRDFGINYCVFGNIKENFDIIKMCCDNFSKGLVISDCGLVIEQE